ncbi:MAG: GNAT family protein [Candidatus Nanohaloarchaea archaeon]|nr:GNAT family protein [Candidatus Nanohaloarchaea archaeon]
MAFLETERLELRPVEKDHAEEIQAVNHSDGMRLYGGIHRPSSIPEIEDHIEETDTIFLSIWNGDDCIGYLGIHQENEISRTEEVFIYLKDSEQGNGYGPEALERAIEYCFDELNLHKVAARAYEHNEPSQKMLERLGFQREGRFREEHHKQGEYRDILRYGLLRDEFQD